MKIPLCTFFAMVFGIASPCRLFAQASLTGDAGITHLKSTGHYRSLHDAITRARYRVQAGSADESVASAANPAHGLFSTFTAEGLRVEVRADAAADAPVHAVTWRLQSVGYGAASLSVPSGALKTGSNRVELVRAALRLTEWFENTPAGLEHGFTLDAPPSTNPRGELLHLVIAVAGDLVAEADDAGQSLSLRDDAGRIMMSYDKLKVWDATGAELPATMRTAAGSVILAVDDTGATYPLTIDPVFGQHAYAKAHNPGTLDEFGYSVAVSGNTVVVGARREGSNATGVNGDGSNNLAGSAGAAYVFVRTGNSWTQQAYLKASNTETVDLFGSAVAISGDTVVVGATGEDSNATGINGNQGDNSASGSGAAYVFVRSGITWTQQAYLKASNTEASDLFGHSVTVAGNTIVVGARGEDSSATGVNGNGADNGTSNSGAAYVFVRSGTTWSQQAYLKASNPRPDDEFGHAVAIAGDSLIVGAPSEDSNATGINGDQNNNLANHSGAAYAFVRSGTIWSQQAYIKASNTGSGDIFGWSVATEGNTVVIGANSEDSNGAGVDGPQTNDFAINAGAAYVFFFQSGSWTQRAYLKPVNTEAGDSFGDSVGISDGTIVIGASFEDSNATGLNGDAFNNNFPDSGAAHIYVRGGPASAPTWTLQDYVKASNTGADDRFGRAVAISGNTIVIGANNEDSNAPGVNGIQNNESLLSAGAAYIFGEPLPPAPEIGVEQPANTNILDGATGQTFVAPVADTATLTFTIRNTGTGNLTGLGITINGSDAAIFSVTAPPTAPVAPGGTTTFNVRFAPTTIGNKTAALHIANDDENENPFDLVLNGDSLSFTADRDGDGLNDAAEFQLAGLGFNYQVSQVALVNLLFQNANSAGLFTEAQVQALHVDTPLLTKDTATGRFKLTIGVQKTTDLALPFDDFPMNGAGFTTVINGAGKLEFQFSVPDNAAFFRLEAN